MNLRSYGSYANSEFKIISSKFESDGYTYNLDNTFDCSDDASYVCDKDARKNIVRPCPKKPQF